MKKKKEKKNEEFEDLVNELIEKIQNEKKDWEISKDPDFDYIIKTEKKVIPLEIKSTSLYAGDISDAKYLSGMIADENNMSTCPLVFISDDKDPDLRIYAEKQNVNVCVFNENNFDHCVERVYEIEEYSPEKCFNPKVKKKNEKDEIK